MTASVGMEIGASGRGGFQTGGLRGASVHGAASANLLSRVQSGPATGELPAGSSPAGAESFQSRWQSMLAAIGEGTGEGKAEQVQDVVASRAAETETGSAPGAPARADYRLGTAADQAQPGVISRGQNALSNAMKGGQPEQSPALTGASIEEPSEAKSSLAETAKTSSRPGNQAGVDAERKRANLAVAPATTTGSAPQVGPADVLAAAIATPAIVRSTARPVALSDTTHPTSSSLNALTNGSSESSSSGVMAQRPGAAPRPQQTGDRSGAAVESAGRKPEVTARITPQGGADGNPATSEPATSDPATQDAPDAGEEAISADGGIPSAQHALGAASTAPVLPRTSENAGSTPAALSAQPDLSPANINSAQPALPLSQASAGDDFVQAPALASARGTSRSTAQPASVRGRIPGTAPASAGVSVPSSGASDSSPLARNPVGASGGVHALNQAPSAAGATSGSRETFAALDAESTAGTPNWIHAGAHQAEAGFQDPALGWVSVRADLSAGGVHAAIVPGSNEAAQLLGGHLAGLNAHLAAEHIPVDSLRMAAATGSDSPGAMQLNAGEHGAQGHGQAPEQGSSNTNTQSGGTSVARSHARDENLPGQAGRLQPEQRPAESILPGLAAKGTHISVLA